VFYECLKIYHKKTEFKISCLFSQGGGVGVHIVPFYVQNRGGVVGGGSNTPHCRRCVVVGYAVVCLKEK